MLFDEVIKCISRKQTVTGPSATPIDYH